MNISSTTRRVATALAAVGTLAMSTGIALVVTATPAEAATKVNVCHATNSDTNPYVFIEVDDDSTKFQGHLAHRNDPNKIWKTAGTFNGEDHAAGDPKPDLIGSYTDEENVFHDLDGEITAQSCEGEVTEVLITASVVFTDPTCASPTEASYLVGGNVDNFTVSVDNAPTPGGTTTVTATVKDGYTFADDAQALQFGPHQFGDALDPSAPPCTLTETPEEPPIVETPGTIVETPNVVHAGFVDSVDPRGQQGLVLMLGGMVLMLVAGGLGMVRPDGGKSKF